MLEEQYQNTKSADWGYGEEVNEPKFSAESSNNPDFARIDEERDKLMRAIISRMREGAGSGAVQKLIERHYQSLKVFHEPSLVLYKGLANLYVEDGKFFDYFAKFHQPDLPRFMHDAMIIFCRMREEKHVRS